MARITPASPNEYCIASSGQREVINRPSVKVYGNTIALPCLKSLGLASTPRIVGSELPEEMTLINEVLDALPDDLANMLLINYFNDLYI